MADPYPASQDRSSRRQDLPSGELLRRLVRERVLLIDGAMGTEIQRRGLRAEDFGGAAYEGCNEQLAITRPDVILSIHRAYLQAGADIIETDTFGSSRIVLAEYGLADRAYEITLAAARLARQAVDEVAMPGCDPDRHGMADQDGTTHHASGQGQGSGRQRPHFVAGSMGPTTRAISVTGGITFAELVAAYAEQAQALVEGGVDYLLLETAQDTRNIKAGLIGIERCCEQLGRNVPIAVSATIEPSGRMLAGQTVEALITSLEHADLLYLGINCATGPEEMADSVRTLAEHSPFPVAVVPNAGLPDERGCYLETPAALRRAFARFLANGWVNLIGGCCGTTPAHIQALAKLLAELEQSGGGVVAGASPTVHQPRARPERGSCLSGLDNLEIEANNRPVLVGERTNVIGSRLFRERIAAGQFDAASDIAYRQVQQGAQVLDICLANPDRDEKADMEAFLARVAARVRVPLMIDSTDPGVIAAALTYCQGKSVINSVNLEDGEERLARVVALAQRWGAAVVAGLIDEQGMALTVERKLAVARRLHALLVHKYGLAEQDVYFDPLTFPCASGDAQYQGAAGATVEAIARLKQEFGRCPTILGISNVSFGLPAAGREVVNAVFLHRCVQAGLDLAMVNTERLRRYALLPETERRLAEQLLFEFSDDHLAEFIRYFRTLAARGDRAAADARGARSEADAGATHTASPDERLRRSLVEGSKEGLEEALEEKLAAGATPLEIINGPLLAGMGEVGRLFNRNELIVAEVLRSAEVMKAAVSYLEPRLGAAAAGLGHVGVAGRGTVVLATVKGDVHDIGKNLVQMILSNNGYRVIDLGTKVAPAQLIATIRQVQPDLVGLSGLLVKSAQQMVATAEEMTAAGVCPPLLVGGAALTEKFVRTRIAPAYGGAVMYARDAMQGLELANRLMDPAARAKLEQEWARSASPSSCLEPNPNPSPTPSPSLDANPTANLFDANLLPPSGVRRLAPDEVPVPPDWQRHVERLRGDELDQVWAYINPVMLYNRHLGLKVRAERAWATGDARALALRGVVNKVQQVCREGVMQVGLVWRFLPAASHGDEIWLRPPERDLTAPVVVLPFPRQARGERLCLADYVHPLAGRSDGDAGEASGSGQADWVDNVCLLAVTAGQGIRALAQRWRDQGQYLRSHVLQALALETAEAAAEWLHQRVRQAWGFPDPSALTMNERFQAHYRGRRYSFGYPACPDLSLQEPLFELLRPEEVGLTLTEGFMMDPEASVSALVLHHPECKYFEV